jgi:hypothetical protein
MRKCCWGARITLRTEVSSQEMKKTLHYYFQMYTTEHQPEMVHVRLYGPLHVCHLPDFDHVFAPIYWRYCASSTNRRRITNISKI